MPPPDWNRKSRLDQNRFIEQLFISYLTYRNSFRFSSTCVKSHQRLLLQESSPSASSFLSPAAASSAIRYARSICFAGSLRRGLLHAIREQLRLPQHELVVQQRQRLRRHRRDIAPAAADVLIRQIEDLEHGEGQTALAIHVDAAPPDRRDRPPRLFQMPFVIDFEDLRRQMRERPAGRPSARFNRAARRQDRCRARSRRRAAGCGSATDTLFVGIFRHIGGVVELRRHLVGLRRHDQPVHLLDAPAAVHELDRQPVEQLRMRRLLAHLAEVIERRHDAAAEMMMPDAIDDHARGQRIVRRRQPLRQRPPAARRCGRRPAESRSADCRRWPR